MEKLHEAGGYIEKDYDTLAYDLRTEYERITRIVEAYELFIIKSNKISSKSVLDRISIREEKSNKARESVSKRWAKVSDKEDKNNTDDIRTYNEGNTIKEKKGKEIKKKESKTETRPRSKKIEEEKKEVFDKVLLTDTQEKQIQELYGNLYKKALAKLSNHKNTKGVTYKSDYHTLITSGWVFSAISEDYPALKEKIEKDERQKEAEEQEKKKKKLEEEEKKKTDEEYNKLVAFYNSLSAEEKTTINARADYELRSFTPQMREKSGKQWENIYKAKVRAVTSTYRDTGEIPEVPPPPAEKETLTPNT